MLTYRIQDLEGVWDDFQTIQDKTIPRLKVLNKIMMSMLIREGIVHE